VARRAAVPPRTIFTKDVIKVARTHQFARGKIENFSAWARQDMQNAIYEHFMHGTIFRFLRDESAI
jgi:hypothetical protein